MNKVNFTIANFVNHPSNKKLNVYEPKIELPLKELKVLDSENVRVRGYYTGICKWLTPEEVTVYDYMVGCLKMGTKGYKFSKCWDWFEKNNPSVVSKILKGMNN